MKVVYFVLGIINLAVVLAKQAIVGYDTPIREVLYRLEFEAFENMMSPDPTIKNKDSLCPARLKSFRGGAIFVNGLHTTLPPVFFNYSKVTDQEVFENLKDELEAYELPETLISNNILHFIINPKGGFVFRKDRPLPKIHTLDDLVAVMNSICVNVV